MQRWAISFGHGWIHHELFLCGKLQNEPDGGHWSLFAAFLELAGHIGQISFLSKHVAVCLDLCARHHVQLKFNRVRMKHGKKMEKRSLVQSARPPRFSPVAKRHSDQRLHISWNKQGFPQGPRGGGGPRASWKKVLAGTSHPGGGRQAPPDT